MDLSVVAATLAFVIASIVIVRAGKNILEWCQAGRMLRQQFPSIPPSSAVLGHVRQIPKGETHVWALNMTQQLGNAFYLRLINTHVVLIADPTLMPAIFDRTNYYPNTDILDRPQKQQFLVLSTVFSRGGLPNLLTGSTADPIWRLVRKGVAPAFNQQNIRHGFEYVTTAANDVITMLKARGPDKEVDMDVAAQRITLEVLGEIGFRKKFGVLASLDHDAEVFKIVNDALHEATLRLRNPLRPYMIFSRDTQQAKENLNKFHTLIEDMVREAKARGTPADDDPTIAGHLLRLRDNSGKPLSDARLHAEFGVLIVAGTDTTGHTIANTLFFISQHPEVEAKVAAELDALGLLVTAQRLVPRSLEFADLAKLVYLGAAIKESMRMIPVVGSGFARMMKHPLQLGPYAIPKNTLLWVPLHALHNSPALWNEPDTYRPERWLEADDVESWPVPAPPIGLASTHQNGSTHGKAHAVHKPLLRSFLPFGDGPRACVGQGLAKMSYTAVLALLTAQFNFQLAERMGGAEKYVATQVSRLTVSPKDGLWMRVIPRT